ncbi:MAG TPA: hypothetical protein ENH19_02860 [Actinobacteria bacterium]|nr:hypothetical protein [Actinomycetes bacterium]HEX21576.1 hypothetical protein [Actinomycetota bacterium]
MLKGEKGTVIIEYALITLLTLGLLLFLVQVSGANIFKIYISKVAGAFLIKVAGIGDLGSAVNKIGRF